MVEDRRNRYNNNQIKNTDLRIDVNLDITSLDLICSYIISNNKNIHRGNVINLRNLFLIMNMNNYNNDQERLKRIDFIMKGIDARLNYNLSDSVMIVNHINGGFSCSNEDLSYFKEMNNDEIKWVDRTVSSILKYSIIYNDVDRGLALLTKFKATEFAERGKIVEEIEEWIKQMQVKFRRSKNIDSSEMTFSLIGDEYVNAMRETYNHLTSPSNKLQFGTQALNALTGGGVQSNRVYTILGLPGEGKSSTLTDMAIQIKRYNKNYVCKDPTKRPCVVLLIMENDVKETIERIFSMCVGVDMTNYSVEEAIDVLKSQGNLTVTDNDPIDIKVIFRPNLSVDTSELYTIVEDLEDEGFETICFIQDYIKRIRSVEGSFGGDLRLQLGAIINEFKIFATLKNIPVITASQLNRTASSAIDEARVKNKADLVRLIGRSNVGESNLIIENSDWIALLAPEYDKDGNKYLGMQRVKSRYYIPGDFYCAYLPYVNPTIKLIEDYYSAVPVHKVTMKEGLDLSGGRCNNVVNEIKEFTEFNNIKLPSNDEDNLFINASSMLAMQAANLVINNTVNKVMVKKVSS